MNVNAGHTLPMVVINQILEYQSQMEDKWWYVHFCERTGRGHIKIWETHPACTAIQNVCEHKWRHIPFERTMQIQQVSHPATMWTLPRYAKDDYIYQPYILRANDTPYTTYLLDECPISESNIRAIPHKMCKLTNLLNDTAAVEMRYAYNRGTLYYKQQKVSCVRVFRKQTGVLEIAGFSTPSHVISARVWGWVTWIYDDVLDKWRQL